MTEALAIDAGTAAPKGVLARAVGMIFAPKATYAAVAASPHWLGAMILVVGVSIVGQTMFFSTSVGREALLDQQVRSLESFGRTVDEAMYQRLESQLQYAAPVTAVLQLVSMPLIMLVVAALAFAVFTAVLGGDATFRQTLAVVAHSGVIVLVQQLFVLPLDYARETLSSPTSLMVFLPFLDEGSFAGRLFGAIDLFLIWWIVNLAIGLAVLYKKRTGPVALALAGVYLCIALAIAGVKTALSGA